MTQYVCIQGVCSGKPFVTNRLHKIEGHLSSKHLDYYPYICAICGENGQEICAPSMNGIQLHNQMHHRGQMEKVKICLDEEKQEELLQLIEMCTQPAHPATAAEVVNGSEAKTTTYQQPGDIVVLDPNPVGAASTPSVRTKSTAEIRSRPARSASRQSVSRASPPFEISSAAATDQISNEKSGIEEEGSYDSGSQCQSSSVLHNLASTPNRSGATTIDERPKRGRPKKTPLKVKSGHSNANIKRIRVEKAPDSLEDTKMPVLSPMSVFDTERNDCSPAIEVEYEEANPMYQRKCKLCSRSITRACNGLYKHVMGHHMAMDCWKCCRCDFHGKWDTYVWRHQNEVHGIRRGVVVDPKYKDEIDATYKSCFGVSEPGSHSFACDLCNFETNTPNGLNLHKDKMHSRAKKTETYTKQHTSRREISPTKRCLLCGEHVLNGQNQGCRRHVIGHHMDAECWVCKYCDFHANWEGSVRNHQRRHHGNTKGVRVDPALNDRINTVYESCFGVSDGVTCDKCSTQLNTPLGLKLHKKRMHPSNERLDQTPKRDGAGSIHDESNNSHVSPQSSPAKASSDTFQRCLLCNENVVRKGDGLYHHTVGKHMDMPCWACSYCDFGNSWKAAVWKHQREQHKEKEQLTVHVDEKYIDQIATKYNCCFVVRFGYENENQSLSCGTCRFQATTPWGLQVHNRVHNSSKRTTPSVQTDSSDNSMDSPILQPPACGGGLLNETSDQNADLSVYTGSFEGTISPGRSVVVRAPSMVGSGCKFCQLCKRDVKSESNGLQKHVIGLHMEVGCWMCPLCDFRAKWDNVVRIHKRAAHNVRTGGVRFDYQYNGQIKAAYASCFGAESSNNLFTCTICGRNTDTKLGLKLHSRVHRSRETHNNSMASDNHESDGSNQNGSVNGGTAIISQNGLLDHMPGVVEDEEEMQSAKGEEHGPEITIKEEEEDTGIISVFTLE